MLRKWKRAWLAVALLTIVMLSIAAPCLANGEGTADDDGDPVDEVPMCKTLNPTAGILGDFWMILMAMAFQLAL